MPKFGDYNLLSTVDGSEEVLVKKSGTQRATVNQLRDFVSSSITQGGEGGDTIIQSGLSRNVTKWYKIEAATQEDFFRVVRFIEVPSGGYIIPRRLRFINKYVNGLKDLKFSLMATDSPFPDISASLIISSFAGVEYGNDGDATNTDDNVTSQVPTNNFFEGNVKEELLFNYHKVYPGNDQKGGNFMLKSGSFVDFYTVSHDGSDLYPTGAQWQFGVSFDYDFVPTPLENDIIDL